MIVAICTALSGVGFYFSLNHGDMWPLAWIAPVPVLWLAFGEKRRVVAFAASWSAYALGSCNILPTYAAIMPAYVLALALAVPALGFAGSVVGAQFVTQRISPLGGMLAFASLWTTWDYVASFSSMGGTSASPAYSQVGAPYLIQMASVFGLWIVTFLLAIVAAGLATSLQTKRATGAAIALGVFALNAGFGWWRIPTEPATAPERIGVAVNDAIASAAFDADAEIALRAVKEYSVAARALAEQGAHLIVFPEKIAILRAAWRIAAASDLQAAAREAHATIVIGFDERGDHRRNEALIFNADEARAAVYFKRHLVAGLESAFTPGDAGLTLPDKTGIMICKDMDFQGTLRSDATSGHLTLAAVPAWDFDGDAWWHARLAIMRGVEDGFAVARAAKHGLLSLSDAYGRLTAWKPSREDGMVTLVGDLARGPGDTLYLRLGDAVAWLSFAASVLLMAVAARGRGSKSEGPSADGGD
jgi:apolipoprotein N-acyltransferase